jgi:hypothetical protein
MPKVASASAPRTPARAAAASSGGAALPPINVTIEIHAGPGEQIDEAMIRRVVVAEMPAAMRHVLEGVHTSMGAGL